MSILLAYNTVKVYSIYVDKIKEDEMVQLVKQHKVTGEIVKVDAKKEWLSITSGTIPANVFAKIKAATEAATEYYVIGQEGVQEREAYVMTQSDKDLKEYCDHYDRVVKAMSY